MKAIAFVLEKGGGEGKSKHSLVKCVCRERERYTKLHSNQRVDVHWLINCPCVMQYFPQIRNSRIGRSMAEG